MTVVLKSKTTMPGILNGERSFMTFLAIRERDRQMDRHVTST